jgi:SpoVK/Ycf46/Vps4 family AAA+-type ATPase
MIPIIIGVVWLGVTAVTLIGGAIAAKKAEIMEIEHQKLMAKMYPESQKQLCKLFSNISNAQPETHKTKSVDYFGNNNSIIQNTSKPYSWCSACYDKPYVCGWHYYG